MLYGVIHTLIILNIDTDWFGWFSIANLIDSFDSEVIHHILRQILQSDGEVFAELAIGNIILIAVLPHLFNIVASDWRTTIATRRFPSQSNSALGPFLIV